MFWTSISCLISRFRNSVTRRGVPLPTLWCLFTLHSWVTNQLWIQQYCSRHLQLFWHYIQVIKITVNASFKNDFKNQSSYPLARWKSILVLLHNFLGVYTIESQTWLLISTHILLPNPKSLSLRVLSHSFKGDWCQR